LLFLKKIKLRENGRRRTITTTAATTTTTTTFSSDAQGWSRAKNVAPKQAAAANTTTFASTRARLVSGGTQAPRRMET